MNCENCNQELPEQAETCPNCGAPCEKTVDVPKKQTMKPWQWVLVVLAGLIVLAALVYGVISLAGAGREDSPENGQEDPSIQTGEPSGEPEGSEDTEPADTTGGTSYTVDDAVLVENSRNVVAAMGGKELTVGELQMHYQSAFYNFYSQNYYYLSYFGLDLERPLGEQYLPTAEGAEGKTWEQYFIDAALDSWHSYVLLELIAEAEGYQMDAELQAALNDMEASIQEMAAAYGYETAEEWLLNEVGAGVTAQDYARYNQAYYLGSSYLNHCYEIFAPTLEDIEAYYTENEAVFTQNGITKDIGLNSAVRHILIQPADTNSETDWAAAKAEAERILQEWKAGEATEESFAELANTYSQDGGSNTTGGLYKDVNVDANYVANFENWAIDASRQPGDTDIVETEFGYHIMYFVSGEEYWTSLVGEQLIAERVKQMMETNVEIYPMETFQENILVGKIKL